MKYKILLLSAILIKTLPQTIKEEKFSDYNQSDDRNSRDIK